uniref:DUF4175 family protein n=1 Tax=Nioella sp. TaxID=1912091 RepID=UPI00351844B1
MTDQTRLARATLDRLAWPLRLTRLGIGAERAVRAFWPVWTIVLSGVAALAFGAAEALPGGGLIGGRAAAGIARVGALVSGLRRLRGP